MNSGAVLASWSLVAEASPSTSRSLAWSMLMTIELIEDCLDRQVLDAALMNQGMLFWFEDHRSEIEAAIAS